MTLIGWLADWLVGWLAGWQTKGGFHHCTSNLKSTDRQSYMIDDLIADQGQRVSPTKCGIKDRTSTDARFD